MKPAASSRPRKTRAPGSVMAPLARGRSRVRSTLASIRRSTMSLTMHPADRITTAPAAKRPRSVQSGHPGDAMATAHQQGHIRSQKPAGLSTRARRNHGCHDSGATVLTHSLENGRRRIQVTPGMARNNALPSTLSARRPSLQGNSRVGRLRHVLLPESQTARKVEQSHDSQHVLR